MTTESILGPMAKRTKIDLRLPVAIAERMKVLADSIGIHTAFILPALCYLYIVYYGFVGSRVIASSASRARG